MPNDNDQFLIVTNADCM